MKRALNITGSITLVALAVAGWFLLAPGPLGGDVSYVVTSGASMQPRLNAGDLVILREQPNYVVGDVAGYHSESLGRVVLHRIVRVEPEGFVFKGDNNDFFDIDRPQASEILGAEWLAIPGAGRALTWVGEPANAAVLVALLTVLMLGGVLRRRKKKRGRHLSKGRAPRRRPEASPSRHPRPALTVAAWMAFASLAVGSFALAQPTHTSETRTTRFESTGGFSYSATAPESAVYPTGRIGTGEPLFLELVDNVDMSFDYRFETDRPHEVNGVTETVVQVSEPGGWTRTFSIGSRETFDGNRTRVAGTLDLGRIRGLMARFVALTGVPQTVYNVSVTPRIFVEGAVDGQPFEQLFTPTARFELDGLRMKPAAPEPAAAGEPAASDPSPGLPGSVAVPVDVPNQIRIGSVNVPITDIRTGALFGLALALVIALIGARRPRKVETTSQIARRYGSLILEVASASAASERKAVQIKELRDLARMAQTYERFILHDESDNVHTYSIEEDGVVYWYQPPIAADPNVKLLPVEGSGNDRSFEDQLARRRAGSR